MVKDLWRRLWAPKQPAPVDSEPLDSEPLDVSEEGPAERRGVSLPWVAVGVLVSSGAVLLAADLVGRTWRADLPPLFVLAGFPLVLCAVSLLTSDVWLTRAEKLDRHLGLSFRGERRQAARRAYADLWRCEPIGADADGHNVYSREDRLAIVEYGMARRLAAEQRLAEGRVR